MPTIEPIADDPLATLHKMSTTAGLGSGDYVAINGVAIATFVLGVASGLTLLNEIFLVVPLVGIACGIVAITQIRRSNGTQTGTLLAAVGLLLSLGLGGWVVGHDVGDRIQRRADRAAIQSIIQEIGKDVVGGASGPNVDAAYARCAPSFQERISPARFRAALATMRSNPLYGQLQSSDAGPQMAFEDDASTGTESATAIMQLHFTNLSADAFRTAVIFRKLHGQWLIFDMPDMFRSMAPNADGSTDRSRTSATPEGPPAPGR